MPLYEYECPRDGLFELVRKFADPPLSACPTCGGPVEKLLSAPAIQFKGTGWYITDYARKSAGGEGGEGGKDGKDKAAAKEGSKEFSSSSASESKSSTAETKSGSTETKPSSSGSGDKK